MIDMGTAIKAQFPEAVPGVDYGFDDENGDGTLELVAWNEEMLGPRPESVEALEDIAESWVLDAAKIRKKQEIARNAVDEISGQYTEGIEGRDELQFELARAVMAIGQALGIQEIVNNPRLGEVVRCGQKARGKQDVIEQATTVDAVQEVEWEDG